MGFYGYGMGGYLLVEGQCGVVERKCKGTEGTQQSLFLLSVV